MNTINFPCEKCGDHLVCDTATAGAVVPCPACLAPIIVPFPPRISPVASESPHKGWKVAAVVAALVVLAGLGLAWATLSLHSAKRAKPTSAASLSGQVNGTQRSAGAETADVKPVAAVARARDEGDDSSSAPPRTIRILQHHVLDSLPTTGEGEKPIALSGAEKKRGLKFLVVDVALPADEAATYPGTQPIVSDENLAYIRPCMESKEFRFVLNASSFALQLSGGKSAEATFIKWPESDSWCAPRDTVIHLVQGGEDACVFHSAQSLVVATNRNPSTLKATLAFKVPGRAASRGMRAIRYEPPPVSDIIAALPSPVIDRAAGMSLTPELTSQNALDPVTGMQLKSDRELQKELESLIAMANMNAPSTANPPAARAVQPRYRQPMPDGPNTLTVRNRCNTWIGLGAFCRRIGSEFQYGSVQGVPAGGNITLVVPNGTFHVYWIRQDRPNSRFRMPNPLTLSGGSDRIQKYATLTINSDTGETPVEEEF